MHFMDATTLRRGCCSEIAMALHTAATPVAQMASVRCAAATENFTVLENHAVGRRDWNDLVTGLPNRIIQDGHIDVPETPGLGVDPNDDSSLVRPGHRPVMAGLKSSLSTYSRAGFLGPPCSTALLSMAWNLLVALSTGHI